MYALVTAALALGLYLFANSRTSLWDRDEPSYARAAVEMRESGNYLVPTFNGQTWTDKPVLFWWLMAGAIGIFGTSEFACRFWSALGMAASCLVVFAVGKCLLDATVGLWAMLILASSPMSIGTGTLAIMDSILLVRKGGAR